MDKPETTDDIPAYTLVLHGQVIATQDVPFRLVNVGGRWVYLDADGIQVWPPISN